ILEVRGLIPLSRRLDRIHTSVDTRGGPSHPCEKARPVTHPTADIHDVLALASAERPGVARHVVFEFPSWGLDSGVQAVCGHMAEGRMPDFVGHATELDIGVSSAQSVTDARSQNTLFRTKGSAIPARRSVPNGVWDFFWDHWRCLHKGGNGSMRTVEVGVMVTRGLPRLDVHGITHDMSGA